MKKLIAASLAGAFILSAAGCAEKKTAKEGGEIETIKVVWPGQTQADLQLINDKLNEITEREIGAKVNLVFIDDGAYTEKMNMKLATKEDFDICFTSSWQNPFGKGIKNDSYMGLTKLIEKNAPKLFETIPDWWWDGTKSDGEIYAVPNMQIAAMTGAVEMDRKYIEKYNIDPDSIKSWDDLEPYMEKIKEGEPDKFVTKPWGNYWITNYENITTGIGLDLRDDGYKAIYEWDADGFEKNMDKLRSWYVNGYFRSDVASVLDDSNDYLAGKYIMLGCEWKPGYESYLNTTLGGDHVCMKVSKPFVRRGATAAAMTAISAYSKHPEAAIKFIELMNTNKEAYNLICHGIEGKHYTRVDENHIKLDPKSGWYFNADWKFGNQFLAELLEGQADDVWEETKRINDEADKSRILDFSFDSSNVQTELSQMATVNQEFKNYNNGSVDWRESYDQYKQRMMSAGIENVLSEVQRQLDEYAKTQK